MRRRLLVAAALLGVVAALFLAWRARSRPEGEKAYVRGRNVTAWNRLAQVREPVFTLRYGDFITVVERRGSYARVRNARGLTGWVDEQHLVEPELWRRAEDLLDQARRLEPQATATTKVVSNLRAEPGRATPRVYQLPAGTLVEVLARAVAEAAPAPEAARPGEPAPPVTGDSPPRREDWLLVRATLPGTGELAGWVLGRFLEPDAPDPLRQLGVGIRWVAWHELNQVIAMDGPKPQFLGAGVAGPEGGPCDFTLLRVYTWHLGRQRYETAYAESAFCGRLPVRLARDADQTRFSFDHLGVGGTERREYRFAQNLTRRMAVPRPHPAQQAAPRR